MKTLAIRRDYMDLSTRVKRDIRYMPGTDKIDWDSVPVDLKKFLIEELAREAGISVYELNATHYRGDTQRNISPIICKPIGRTLTSFYDKYRKDPLRGEQETTSYILKKMGFKPFEELPLLEQLEIIKRMKDIRWNAIPNSVKKYLIEALATKAGITVYELTTDQYLGNVSRKIKPIVIDEIGRTLAGLYKYLTKDVDCKRGEINSIILRAVGIKPFEELTLEEQIAILKRTKDIQWARVPIILQRYLVEQLAEKSGLSIYELTSINYKGDAKRGKKPIVVDCIGKDIRGLYEYYGVHPERNKTDICSFMLQKLGYKPFSELSLIDQLDAMKRMNKIIWESIPIDTQRYLIEELARTAGISVYELTQKQYNGNTKAKSKPIEIKRIGKNLSGLYSLYESHPERGDCETSQFILVKLGLNFGALPIEKQLQMMKKMKRINWSAIPVATQRYLIEELARICGVSVYELMDWHYLGKFGKGHKATKLESLEKSIAGLFNYYKKKTERQDMPTKDYILKCLGYGDLPFILLNRRAVYAAQSFYQILMAMRKLVKIWVSSGRKIKDIKAKDIIAMVERNKEFLGFVHAIKGSNDFGFSTLELLCLAMQHVPLDELGIHDSPNYLRPAVIGGFKGEVGRINSAIVGSYLVELKIMEEIKWFIKILEKSLEYLREHDSEKTRFTYEWVETQLKILGALRSRYLTAPLASVLGTQNYNGAVMPIRGNSEHIDGPFDEVQKTTIRLILNGNNPLVLVSGVHGSGKTQVVLEAVKHLVKSGKRVFYAVSSSRKADDAMERISGNRDFDDIPMLRTTWAGEDLSMKSSEYWSGNYDAKQRFKEKKRSVKGSLFVGSIEDGVDYALDQESPVAYDVVIIDDAGDISKPEAIALLNFSKRAVMAGDILQSHAEAIEQMILGMDISEEMNIFRLTRSLFDDLVLNGYPHVMLETSYRAVNPAMVLLVSRIFFDERIRVNHNSPYFSISKKERKRKFSKDSLKLIDTSGLHSSEEKGKGRNGSYVNEKEADLVVEEVRKNISLGYSFEDIMILTPYIGQVKLVREKLQDVYPEISIENIERMVRTFDEINGIESKCVVISFVRNSSNKSLNGTSLDSYQKLYYGLTIARERMAVIGDLNTLKNNGNGQNTAGSEIQLQMKYMFRELEKVFLEMQDEGISEIVRLTK